MPLGFINLGFETGASPSGHMAGWSSVFFSSTFQFVGFGDTLETVSWEDFEHEWGGNDDGYFEFEPDNLVIAIYDLIPQPYEDFNSEWADGNQVHYIVMPGTILAAYDKVIYPDDIDYEPFEVGWESNEDDILLFAPGDTALASYDTVPEDFEDFGHAEIALPPLPEEAAEGERNRTGLHAGRGDLVDQGRELVKVVAVD